MSKVPRRILGLTLLMVAICIPSCQALFHATTIPEALERQQPAGADES
jgi:hypothetical protein